VWLFIETLRLAVIDRLLHGSRSAGSDPGAERKEPFIMFRRDVLHALRLFVREPGFTATVIFTLALGIGANTALFAIVEAVLLRPLPYTQAGDLAIVRHRDVRSGLTKEFIALGDFIDLRQRQQSFQAFAGYGGFNSTLVGDKDSMSIRGLSATPELIDVFNLQPSLGRSFTA